MEKKENGFFQMEVIIALALLAIFLTVFAKHFMLAAFQDTSMLKRNEVLDLMIDCVEREEAKGIVRECNVAVEPDIATRQALHLLIGDDVQLPRNFILRQYRAEWGSGKNRMVLVDGKTRG